MEGTSARIFPAEYLPFSITLEKRQVVIAKMDQFAAQLMKIIDQLRKV
jgi:hypothetical protein